MCIEISQTITIGYPINTKCMLDCSLREANQCIAGCKDHNCLMKCQKYKKMREKIRNDYLK